jgi:hypothetical protein
MKSVTVPGPNPFPKTVSKSLASVDVFISSRDSDLFQFALVVVSYAFAPTGHEPRSKDLLFLLGQLRNFLRHRNSSCTPIIRMGAAWRGATANKGKEKEVGRRPGRFTPPVVTPFGVDYPFGLITGCV